MTRLLHSKNATEGAIELIRQIDNGELKLDVLPNSYDKYNGKLENSNYVSYCSFLQSVNGKNVLKMLEEEDEMSVW